eukprot:4098314-Amphidinium_carterae.3
MTTPLTVWCLTQPSTITEWSGEIPYRNMCGNCGPGNNLICVSIKGTMPRDGDEECNYSVAALAKRLEAGPDRSGNAAAAIIWHVKHTWRHRRAWTEWSPCVLVIRTSTSHQERTSPGCDTSGTKSLHCNRAWLNRPKPQRAGRSEILHLRTCQTCPPVAWLDRPWWKPVVRIGEAKHPGPH